MLQVYLSDCQGSDWDWAIGLVQDEYPDLMSEVAGYLYSPDDNQHIFKLTSGVDLIVDENANVLIG